jgi:Domain of unknown function (DUF4287)
VTFQAYVDNIERKTGKNPDDFHAAATAGGILDGAITATQFVDWVKRDFGLGHGHAMAILAVFKKRGWVSLTPSRASKGAKS